MMPTYRITAPDGKSYDVTAPEGASEQDVLAYAQRSFKMAAAPRADAPKPSKPFGEQLNEAIAGFPRAAGVTGRAVLEALGNAADFVASPIRNKINASLREGQLIDDVMAGRVAPGENVARAVGGLPSRQTMAGIITGQQIPGASRPQQIAAGSGQALSNLLSLPTAATADERIASDIAGTATNAMLGMGAGRAIAQAANPVVAGVGRMLAANPGMQLASAAAAGGAGGYTRETGGNRGSQLAASLAAGIATPFAINGAQRAAAAVRQAVTPRPVAAPQIDITINNALRDNGVTLGDLPADVARSIRADVAQALQTGGNLSADAVRRLADYRLIGLTPTRASLTLNPADITRQKNLAKLGANSSDPAAQELAEVQNANNRALTQGLNDLGAAAAGDPISGAQRVMGALSARNDRAKAIIDSAYQSARDTEGRAAMLDPAAFTRQADDLLKKALLQGKLPADVRQLINGTATGEIPFTVDVAEQFKTRLAEAARDASRAGDGSTAKAVGLVRQALEDTPLQPGQNIGQQSIDAFNKARALNRSWMTIVERTPALQAVRDGIEPDKFVQQYIIGSGNGASTMGVAQLKNSIKGNADAMQAVKEQIAAYLKNRALGGAADEVGNFSQSAYNKALEAVGDRKLSLFFSPEEVGRLKAIGRVASYEQVQPAGAAVNNSNTAGAMGGLLERLAGSALLGKVPLGRAAIGDPLQNIVIGQQAGNALNAPRALLGAPGAAPVTPSRTIPLIPPSLLFTLPMEKQ
jgi:hypothetical protein